MTVGGSESKGLLLFCSLLIGFLCMRLSVGVVKIQFGTSLCLCRDRGIDVGGDDPGGA